MSLSERVCPLLVARAATDPDAARLLEMFRKADEILSERSQERVGDVEYPSSERSSTRLALSTAPLQQPMGITSHRQ